MKLTGQQQAVVDAVAGSAHITVNASAGTGKTSTGFAALAVAGGSRLFTCFNKRVAEELAVKAPSGVRTGTTHSLGYALIRSHYPRCAVDDRGYKVIDGLCQALGLRRDQKRIPPGLLHTVSRLTSLCMSQGLKPESVGDDIVGKLVAFYDVDTNGSRIRELSELVSSVLRYCIGRMDKVSFDEMIWLPGILGLRATNPADLLAVDEAQDLNPAQQDLVMRLGRRLILLGDPRQAIYGFRGADTRSMETLGRQLAATEAGHVELRLSKTWRCPKSVVRLAKAVVPDYEALPEAPDGEIVRVDSHDIPAQAGPGCLVLCRVNAPLVRFAYSVLKNGRKVCILGKEDLGQGLADVVRRLQAESISDLAYKVSEWYAREEEKILAERRPSEYRLAVLRDKHECLIAFMEDATSVEEVVRRIERLFVKEHSSLFEEYIVCSSIHRAKGMEADTVFILHSRLLPHPAAKQAWELEQENNLAYVAVTRAKARLVIDGTIPCLEGRSGVQD